MSLPHWVSWRLNIGGSKPSKKSSSYVCRSVNHALCSGDLSRFVQDTNIQKSVPRMGSLRAACAYRTVSHAVVLVVSTISYCSAGTRTTTDQGSKDHRKRKPDQERGTTGKSARIAGQVVLANSTGMAGQIVSGNKIWMNDHAYRKPGCLMNKSHGDVGLIPLTQFLPGHSLFQSYMHNIGNATGPNCLYCGHKKNAIHTFLERTRYTRERSWKCNGTHRSR